MAPTTEVPVEVRLFGSFEVLVGGELRPITGHGERSLLGALACAAGRVVPVDRLIDDLWGERLPTNPANALQVRVSKLRRQVGAVVATRPPGYVLDVHPDDVDVHRFARLVAARAGPRRTARASSKRPAATRRAKRCTSTSSGWTSST